MLIAALVAGLWLFNKTDEDIPSMNFGATGTTNYSTIGTNNSAVGTASNCNNPGLLITMPVSGTITKFSAYVANSTGTAAGNFSLYAGSAGARGALITGSNTGSITTSFAWVDFTLASPYSAAAGTYWIQFNGQCGNGPGGNLSTIKSDTGGASNTGYSLSDIGAVVYNTNQYSMYATYDTADGQVAHANVNIGNSNVVISNSNVVIP